MGSPFYFSGLLVVWGGGFLLVFRVFSFFLWSYCVIFGSPHDFEGLLMVFLGILMVLWGLLVSSGDLLWFLGSPKNFWGASRISGSCDF